MTRKACATLAVCLLIGTTVTSDAPRKGELADLHGV
jgi:hypothetical protein